MNFVKTMVFWKVKIQKSKRQPEALLLYNYQCKSDDVETYRLHPAHSVLRGNDFPERVLVQMKKLV